jgi:hypothetical protein
MQHPHVTHSTSIYFDARPETAVRCVRKDYKLTTKIINITADVVAH